MRDVEQMRDFSMLPAGALNSFLFTTAHEQLTTTALMRDDVTVSLVTLNRGAQCALVHWSVLFC